MSVEANSEPRSDCSYRSSFSPMCLMLTYYRMLAYNSRQWHRFRFLELWPLIKEEHQRNGLGYSVLQTLFLVLIVAFESINVYGGSLFIVYLIRLDYGQP